MRDIHERIPILALRIRVEAFFFVSCMKGNMGYSKSGLGLLSKTCAIPKFYVTSSCICVSLVKNSRAPGP